MYRISITPEEIEALEQASFPGRITVIDSFGPEFQEAVQYLKRQPIIGFDTESRPSFTPDQPRFGVSLLQLSGPDQAFLFRLKMLGGMHKDLCNILADKDIIKVGAAVNDDVRGLERYHDFEARSFVDLQKIVCEWGIRDKSVKKMAAIILGIRISKTQQLSNWEAETLSEPQQKYAATDAWVCREMFVKLMQSEKHPLTPEELNPPQQAPAAGHSADSPAGHSADSPAARSAVSPAARSAVSPAAHSAASPAARSAVSPAAHSAASPAAASSRGKARKKPSAKSAKVKEVAAKPSGGGRTRRKVSNHKA